MKVSWIFAIFKFGAIWDAIVIVCMNVIAVIISWERQYFSYLYAHPDINLSLLFLSLFFDWLHVVQSNNVSLSRNLTLLSWKRNAGIILPISVVNISSERQYSSRLVPILILICPYSFCRNIFYWCHVVQCNNVPLSNRLTVYVLRLTAVVSYWMNGCFHTTRRWVLISVEAVYGCI